MSHKLKLIRAVAPVQKKSILNKWADSPVGWWNVTTEGDVEGHTTKQLGIHYGHVAEIAFSLECTGYSLRFEKANEPSGASGLSNHHIVRQAIAKTVNITLPPFDLVKPFNTRPLPQHQPPRRLPGHHLALVIGDWLDCPEVNIRLCKYHGAYTLELL